MSKILCVLKNEKEFLDEELTLWNIKGRIISILRSITAADLDPDMRKKHNL